MKTGMKRKSAKKTNANVSNTNIKIGTDRVKRLVLFAIVAVFLSVGYLLYSGDIMLKNVLSGSMAPTFNAGDTIIISKVNPADVKKDDIITFTVGKALTTHRVIEVKNGSFVTKGDANEKPDLQMVSSNAVVGRLLFSIPYFGDLGDFVRTGPGFLLVVFIPAALVIYYEIKKIRTSI